MSAPDDYRDPWRTYTPPPGRTPGRRLSMGTRFLLGLPFVAAFWIVAAIARAIIAPGP